jgi:hypothetical protein
MMRDYVKEKVLARGKKISIRKGLPDEANPAILPCFKLRGEARVYNGTAGSMLEKLSDLYLSKKLMKLWP